MNKKLWKDKKKFNKLKKKFKNDIKMTIIFILGLELGLIFVPMLGSAYASFMNSNVSCEGVEMFYTGDSFFADYYDMMEYINYTPRNGMLSPKELFENGGDCESISHAVHCLAKMYDMPCKTYTKYIAVSDTNKNNIEYTGHVGIKCLVRVNNKLMWMNLN